MSSSGRIGLLPLVKCFYSNRPNFEGRIPTSLFLAPLKKPKDIIFCHPLDDEKEYRRYLKEDLPNDIIEYVPNDICTAQTIVEMMNYNIPLFHPCWTFGPELIYRTALPKEEQTEEGLRKARILRACIELRHTGGAVIDDIMDSSDQRCGKPAWHKASPKGLPGALAGGILLNQMQFHLLKKHFYGSPIYQRILDKMLEAEFITMIGVLMDVHGQGGSTDKDIEPAMMITEYKAGSIIGMQATIGMLNAGIEDLSLQKKAERVFSILGEIFQSWDDFCDYYCTPEQTRKPSRDFINGGTTWASGAAEAVFNDEQKEIFKRCYGSEDPSDHERVRQLYDSVDLPRLYLNYVKDRNVVCRRLIDSFNHPGLERSCTSLVDWMIGDI